MRVQNPAHRQLTISRSIDELSKLLNKETRAISFELLLNQRTGPSISLGNEGKRLANRGHLHVVASSKGPECMGFSKVEKRK